MTVAFLCSILAIGSSMVEGIRLMDANLIAGAEDLLDEQHLPSPPAEALAVPPRLEKVANPTVKKDQVVPITHQRQQQQQHEEAPGAFQVEGRAPRLPPSALEQVGNSAAQRQHQQGGAARGRAAAAEQAGVKHEASSGEVLIGAVARTPGRTHQAISTTSILMVLALPAALGTLYYAAPTVTARVLGRAADAGGDRSLLRAPTTGTTFTAHFGHTASLTSEALGADEVDGTAW